MNIKARAKELRYKFCFGDSISGYIDVRGSECAEFIMELSKYIESEILKAKIDSFIESNKLYPDPWHKRLARMQKMLGELE